MEQREKQYITLHGKVVGVLSKNLNRVTVFFRDYEYGDLLCSADKDSILYENPLIEDELQLKVSVIGIKVRGKKGDVFTHNGLEIKEIELVQQ